MDNVFYLTLFFIFVSALVGTFFRSRSRDRCLKSFDENSVILHEVNRKINSGVLKVFPTGIILKYHSPIPHSDYLAQSYVLFQHEQENLVCICRHCTELTDTNLKQRFQDVVNTIKRPWWKRIIRRIRNFFNTFRDALIQSLNLFIGQMKKTKSSLIFTTQDNQLSTLSREVVGYAGNSYEPILENHIGLRVAFQVDFADTSPPREFHGFLREYSDKYLEILDVDTWFNYDFEVDVLKERILLKNLQLSVNQLEAENAVADLKLINNGPETAVLNYLSYSDEKSNIVELEPVFELCSSDCWKFPETVSLNKPVKLQIGMKRKTDMVVSRRRAVVRYVVDWDLNLQEKSQSDQTGG